MASLVGSRGRVLATEPNPALRHRLQAICALTISAKAEIIPCAAANTERMTDFYAPAANDLDSGNGHVVEAGPAKHGGTIRVETRRMDAIVSAAGGEHLDLSRLDVEGLEWPVLRGGESTIAKFRPHIVFEYNAESASRAEELQSLSVSCSERIATDCFQLADLSAEIEGDQWS
jgi:FkbM family methyltransferase